VITIKALFEIKETSWEYIWESGGPKNQTLGMWGNGAVGYNKKICSEFTVSFSAHHWQVS
jgi:hypothetical protein